MIPIVDTDEKGILKNITCFALDMDGTVYLGDKWIEGARDFLQAVEKAGKKYVFLTNNSSKDPGTYIKKLGNMGLETGIEKIVTSGMATIDYLKRNFSGKRVYLLGNELLQAEFLEEGIILDEGNPEVAVVGFDTSLTYQKMCRICDLVRNGLPYISTHPDYNCPRSMPSSTLPPGVTRITLSENRTAVSWIIWPGKPEQQKKQPPWWETGCTPMWRPE